MNLKSSKNYIHIFAKWINIEIFLKICLLILFFFFPHLIATLIDRLSRAHFSAESLHSTLNRLLEAGLLTLGYALYSVKMEANFDDRPRLQFRVAKVCHNKREIPGAKCGRGRGRGRRVQMESLGQRDVRRQGTVSLRTISGRSRDLLIIVQHFEFPGTRDAVVALRCVASHRVALHEGCIKMHPSTGRPFNTS